VTDLQNIWKVTETTYETPLGTVYFVGFMGMFGAAAHSSYEARQRMAPATESQVHYAISLSFEKDK
jgi:hypothetical protein